MIMDWMINTLEMIVHAWGPGAGMYWDILDFLKWVKSTFPTI